MTIGVLKVVFVLLYAYLVGSIPLAYLLGRWMKGIDIRQYGSGSVGGSNVWVHVGKWVIVPLGLFDLFVKGASPVWIARYGLGLGPEVQAAGGLLAVVGHSWSLYIGFSGGRGIAPLSGVLYAIAPLNPIELGGFIVVGVGGFLVFRSSALWVGIAALLLPVWSFLAMKTVGRDPAFVVLMSAMIVALALKRLVSNPGVRAPKDIPLGVLLLRRLLYDRDIPGRDRWVYQKPPQASKAP